MSRAAVLPADTWPPRMPAELAAAYCGEVTVEAFLKRVGTAYPQPRWIESSRRKFWYRDDLDRSMGISDRPTGMGARFADALRKERNG